MKKQLIAFLLIFVTALTIFLAGATKSNAASNGVEDFVKRLYSVCLDREADTKGLSDWSNALKDKKATGISAAYGFVFSQEFQSKNCTNEQYVTYMYNAFFGRQPDAVGLEGWVDALNQGYSRERVFCGFANSTEFQILCDSYGIVRGYHVEGSNFAQTAQVNLFVDRLYDVVLERKCDPQGMADWTSVLVSRKASGADVAYGLVFSKEFTSKKYCNRCYIDILYRAFLGREADKAGRSAWLSALEPANLADRCSRAKIFNGFAGSNEFNQICASFGIDAGNIAVPAALDKTYGSCPKCNRFTSGGVTIYGLYYTGSTHRYFDEEGLPVKGWKQLEDSKGTSRWYYFDDDFMGHQNWLNYKEKKYFFYNGGMITGFYTYRNDRYFFDKKDGYLHTGWINDDSRWYYADKDGVIQTGWQDIGEHRYYFDNNGIMYTGTHYIDGVEYYFHSKEGYLPTGWFKRDDNSYNFWYYANEDGSLHKDWLKLDGNYYYFPYVLGYGAATGRWTIDGDIYYFDNDSCKLVSGWQGGSFRPFQNYFDPETYKMVTGWKKIDGKWYYFDKDGKCYTGKNTIGGKTYYFDNSTGEMWTGWVKTQFDYWHYYDSEGQAPIGWTKINGKWYYFEKDDTYLNEMRTGFLTLSDGTYYLDEKDGYMVTGFVTLTNFDGRVYETYFDENGRQAKVGWNMIGGLPFCFRKHWGVIYLVKNEVIWNVPLNGNEGRYGVDENGRIRVGWYEDPNYGDYPVIYYFSPYTYKAYDDGWNIIDGYWYYFYPGGSMASNTEIDGYKIGSNGIAYDYPG